MKKSKNWKRRIVSAISACALAVTGTVSALSNATASADSADFTYGDAVKLSLYFYDANQCGTKVDDNCLTWRGNCHTYDAQAELSNAKGLSSTSLAKIQEANGGSTTVDVSGGYHDAGDHLKFSMTMGFSMTCLAWSYLENPEAYTETDSEDHLLYILKEMCDYFMKVTYLDDNDDVIAFCYMVGGDEDHNYWTAPETQTMNRPTYWADASHPSVDASAFMSSTFSSCYLAFQDKNPEYAAELLTYANALDEFTEAYPNATYDGVGSYYACENIQDKLAWSDLWCTIANNDGTLPSSYTPISVSNGVYNGSYYDFWIFCWSKVWGGYSALLYSMDPDKYSAYGQELVYEMGKLVTDYSQAYYPVGGGWGASRYNCAWQMYAMTYSEYSGTTTYQTYAKSQMDYLLGNNSANRSYLLGYGDSWPTHIHHRAANPGTGDPNSNTEATYTLYGALVGGPTDSNGSYDDNQNSYSCTEPALDYNGCFALAIAWMYHVYGGSSDAADATIAEASEIKADFVFDYGASDDPITEETTTTTEETTTTTEETTTETTTEETTTTTEETTTEETTTTEVTTTIETTTTEATTSVETTQTDATSETTVTSTETTTTSTSETSTPSSSGHSLRGDVNLDGNVNLADTILLSKRAVYLVDFGEIAEKNADCNNDGIVNGDDVLRLLQFVVQVIYTLE